MALAEGEKPLFMRWRWDSGLFNVIVRVRAADGVVAASWGALHEGPAAGESRPGGVALLDVQSGSELWKVETPAGALPAAFIGGLVVVGTEDGTVFAFDRSSGAERWRSSFDGLPFQALNAGGVLVLADADPAFWEDDRVEDATRLAGRVWGIDPATGAQLWKTTVGSSTAFVAADQSLVVAAAVSGHGTGATAAIDAHTGRELWRRDLEVSSPPAIQPGLVILPGEELLAVHAGSGESLWRRPPVDGGEFLFPALIGNLVVAATTAGTVELTTATGPGAGGVVEYAAVEKARGEWFPVSGTIYGLLRGGLVRLVESSGRWQLVTVLVPQGRIDSAAPAGAGIVFSTGIGSAPESVILVEP